MSYFGNAPKNIICPDALLDIETHHGRLKIKETALIFRFSGSGQRVFVARHLGT